MLRSVAAWLFAAAFLPLSMNAFRQAVGEFRDTEPGSILFGVLQLLIGTAAVLAAIGLVKRARWTAASVAIWGVATAALLAVQPVYEPMNVDAQRSIWLGAAVIGVAAAGVSWFALGLARHADDSRTVPARTPIAPAASAMLTDARKPAESVIARTGDAPVSRGTARDDERPRIAGMPYDE